MRPNSRWCYIIALTVTALILSGTFGNSRAATKVSFSKCLTCHESLQSQLKVKGAHAPFRNFECGSCHDSHASNYEFLLKKETGALCMRCHEAKLGNGNFLHAPVEEGNCLKCHDPHASSGQYLLVESRDKLCFNCHESESLFVGGKKHAPAKKGQCLKCHDAHGSDYATLLKKDKVSLCSSCHTGSKKPTKKAHQNFTVSGTSCVSCHNPHGSPNKNLIRKTQHKPFAGKNCNACHKADTGSAALKKKGTQVCLQCHDQVAQEFNKVFSHTQAGMFCSDCHNPHASDYPQLTRNTLVKTCYKCHQDTLRRVSDKKAVKKHPEVEKGNCIGCHAPHGSDLRMLLRDEEYALCVKCHERHGTFSHPHGEDTTDPRSKRDINCTTCHDLKGSPFEYAMRFDRKKDLCVQCHASY